MSITIGDNDRENCTQIAYQGMYNWYEASMECRDKGGNLGDSSFDDYSTLSDGAYWYGWRRWLLKQTPTGTYTATTRTTPVTKPIYHYMYNLIENRTQSQGGWGGGLYFAETSKIGIHSLLFFT